jgi:hypothetical protein
LSITVTLLCYTGRKLFLPVHCTPVPANQPLSIAPHFFILLIFIPFKWLQFLSVRECAHFLNLCIWFPCKFPTEHDTEIVVAISKSWHQETLWISAGSPLSLPLLLPCEHMTWKLRNVWSISMFPQSKLCLAKWFHQKLQKEFSQDSLWLINYANKWLVL